MRRKTVQTNIAVNDLYGTKQSKCRTDYSPQWWFAVFFYFT